MVEIVRRFLIEMLTSARAFWAALFAPHELEVPVTIPAPVTRRARLDTPSPMQLRASASHWDAYPQAEIPSESELPTLPYGHDTIPRLPSWKLEEY